MYINDRLVCLMKRKKEGANTEQYNLVGWNVDTTRCVVFQRKLNHLSFDFRLFKNPHVDHRGIEELWSLFVPLLLWNFLLLTTPVLPVILLWHMRTNTSVPPAARNMAGLFRWHALWNCTHFRHPADEQLRHVDIYFLATKIICSLCTLNCEVEL